jgi:hypothetical protein
MPILLGVFLLLACTARSNISSSTSTPKVFPLQTSTSTPHPVPTVSNTPTIQDTLEPIVEVRMTSVAYYEKQCDGYFMSEFMSPDQNWALCGDTEKITAIGKDGIRWNFSVIEKYGVQSFEPEIAPVYWAPDNQYVFIKYSHVVDGAFIYDSTVALWRMNLRDGSVSEIIKPVIEDGHLNGHFYAVTISPTGRRMAYVDQLSLPVLVIVDMNSGEVTKIKIPKPYTNAGDFSWTPDGTELIFELAGPNTDYIPTYFSEMWVSFPSLYSKIFISKSSTSLSVQEIADQYALLSNDNGSSWKLEFDTGDVTQK